MSFQYNENTSTKALYSPLRAILTCYSIPYASTFLGLSPIFELHHNDSSLIKLKADTLNTLTAVFDREDSVCMLLK